MSVQRSHQLLQQNPAQRNKPISPLSSSSLAAIRLQLPSPPLLPAIQCNLHLPSHTHVSFYHTGISTIFTLFPDDVDGEKELPTADVVLTAVPVIYFFFLT